MSLFVLLKMSFDTHSLVLIMNDEFIIVLVISGIISFRFSDWHIIIKHIMIISYLTQC